MNEQEQSYFETRLESTLRELASAFCERLGNDKAWGKVEVCIRDGKVKSWAITETERVED